MIRAVYRDGVIQPLEPVLAHWKDGTMLWVSVSEEKSQGRQQDLDDTGNERQTEPAKN